MLDKERFQEVPEEPPLKPKSEVPFNKRSISELQAIADVNNHLPTNDDLEQPYDAPKKRGFGRKLLAFLGWMLLIVALTGAGGGAAWYFWLRNEPKQPAATQQETPPPAAEPAALAEETETYNSSVFMMQFDHPKGWTVTEGSDNKIVTVSPAISLKAAGGKNVNGQIVFTVQRKQASLPDFATGSALAIHESEKIDYKKPSTAQRGSTYISFLSYAASSVAGLDAIYVTGDNGYIKDQYVPMADIAKSDPLISITFRSCKDEKCATPDKALTLAESNWSASSSFAKPLRAMLQSIVVQ